MHCREALSLFSARVDSELTGSETDQLETHLGQCPGCLSQWDSYYSTFRMVCTLPKIETPPAFVGQVLDRVRAYEAEGDPFLEPLDRPAPEPVASVRRVSWFEIAKDRVQDWVRPPVLAAGSLAFGAALGLLAFDGEEAAEPGNHSAAVNSPTTSPSAVPVVGPLSLPFADIADDIRVSDPSESVLSGRGSLLSPIADPTVSQQQVRLGNEAPRITF